MVEQGTLNPKVEGSNPSRSTTKPCKPDILWLFLLSVAVLAGAGSMWRRFLQPLLGGAALTGLFGLSEVEFDLVAAQLIVFLLELHFVDDPLVKAAPCDAPRISGDTSGF